MDTTLNHKQLFINRESRERFLEWLSFCFFILADHHWAFWSICPDFHFLEYHSSNHCNNQHKFWKVMKFKIGYMIYKKEGTLFSMEGKSDSIGYTSTILQFIRHFHMVGRDLFPATWKLLFGIYNYWIRFFQYTVNWKKSTYRWKGQLTSSEKSD